LLVVVVEVALMVVVEVLVDIELPLQHYQTHHILLLWGPEVAAQQILQPEVIMVQKVAPHHSIV
jgi:hypothetical protein